MRLILRYIRRHIGMFLTALFFLCVETLADLMQPTFMAYIVDNGVKGKDVGQILHLHQIGHLHAALIKGIKSLSAKH